MHTPSEYVPAAKARLRDSLIPDCSEAMRHGDYVATVTRVGSPRRGERALTASEPAEEVRVLAAAADFPALTRGSAVYLGDTLRVVTRLTRDIVRTGYSVSLSEAFDKFPVAWFGVRREDGRARQLRFNLEVLMLDGESGTPIEDDTLAIRRAFTVYVSGETWPDVTPPREGDELTMAGGRRLVIQQVEYNKFPEYALAIATADVTVPRR